MTKKNKELSSEQHEELLKILKARFEKNMNRHKGLEWAKVQSRVLGMDVTMEKLWSLHEMERTGGEPDVVGHDKKNGRLPAVTYGLQQWQAGAQSSQRKF